MTPARTTSRRTSVPAGARWVRGVPALAGTTGPIPLPPSPHPAARSVFDAARRQAEDCLASGKPREKWNEMLAAQGADLEAFSRKLARDHTAPVVVELKASKEGFVSRCDARIIGEVVRDLGGGRLTKDSAINYDVGVDQLAKPGYQVRPGAVMARVHAADQGQLELAQKRLMPAFEISLQPQQPKKLISEALESFDEPRNES